MTADATRESVASTRRERRTGATAPSCACDTVSSNNISYVSPSYTRVPVGPHVDELEVPSDALLRRGRRRAGRFLKGPIPMDQVAVAAKLPGKALALLLAVHHREALTRKRCVTLPKGLLADLGVSRDAKARGLRCLEEAGLVRVERSPGRSVRVELIT